MNDEMVVVLDASALLALVFKEPGADVVVEALKAGTQMSAVNAAEVASCLHREGRTASNISILFEELPISILPFDLNSAMVCGRYRPDTDHLGLGLGDRACLATACLQAGTALTADRAWAQLDLQGFDIRCIS